MHASQIASAEPVEADVDIGSAVEELPVIGGVAVVPGNRLSSQMISILAECATFSADEKRAVLASLQDKASRKMYRRYGYDIRATFGNSGKRSVPEEVVIRLSSKNFGYDFTLVKVATGRTLFGSPRYEVRIYMSRLDEDEYVFLESAPNLTKAVGLIDKMYCREADLHLA